LSAALSFALPISTPPNAIAYATGVFTQFELLKVGGFLTLFGTQSAFHSSKLLPFTPPLLFSIEYVFISMA
jgi:di/tricarboxylate transporter